MPSIEDVKIESVINAEDFLLLKENIIIKGDKIRETINIWLNYNGKCCIVF